MSIPQIYSYPEPATFPQVVPSSSQQLFAFGERDAHSQAISAFVFGEDQPSCKRRRTDSGHLDAYGSSLDLYSPGRHTAVSPASTLSTESGVFDSECFDLLFEGSMQTSSGSRAAAERLGIKDSLKLTDGTEVVLSVVEQPEEYYRARYGSEGVRAPIKARDENHHPTVQVKNYPHAQYGRVEVKLVHEDGTDHVSCSLDDSEERKNALTKDIGPHGNMTAEFEDLRIRREKRPPRVSSEMGKKQAHKPVAKLDHHDDKKACLLFTATLRIGSGGETISLQTISSPISLTAPPDPAYLEWLMPEKGHFSGNEPIVIKGSKMTSPKVIFRVLLPNNQYQDLSAVVDKDKSHQNVLVAKTPSLMGLVKGTSSALLAQVIVFTGRTNMESNSLQYQYLSDEICSECNQIKPASCHAPPHYVTGLATSPPPSAASLPPHPMQQHHGHLDTYTAKPSTQPPYTTLPPFSQLLPTHPHSLPPTTTAAATESVVQDLRLQTCTPRFTSPSGMTICYSPQQKGDSSCDLLGLDLYNPSAGDSSQGGVASSGSFQADFSEIQSNSPNSDAACFSPVTPISPNPEGCWADIEQILHSFINEGVLSKNMQKVLLQCCHSQDSRLFQAYTAAQNNRTNFFHNLKLAFEPSPQYTASQ